MQTVVKSEFPEEWIRILTKGMITIPKVFRDELGIKEGEIAKIRKVGKRLVIEPREIADYEVYSDKELAKMLAEDKLPRKLAKSAEKIWSDLE